MHRLRNVDFPAVDRRKKLHQCKRPCVRWPCEFKCTETAANRKRLQKQQKNRKNNAVKVHKEEREKCFGETKQKTAKSKQMFTILYELCD